MFTDISKSPKNLYAITEPGIHVFLLRNVDADITFDIVAPGARVYIFGLYDLATNQSRTLHLKQRHLTDNCRSSTLVKAVLRKESRFRFTGRISVQSQAAETEAYCYGHALLLERSGLAVLRPEMDVAPSQILCRHGATVSPPPQASVNYLKQRGLDTPEAQKLLAEGFLSDIQRRIEQLRKNR